MSTEPSRQDLIIAAYAAGDKIQSIQSRFGADRLEIETLVAGISNTTSDPDELPVMAAHKQPTSVSEPGQVRPPNPHKKWLNIAIASAAVAVAGAGVLAIIDRPNDKPPPPTSFENAQRSCDPSKAGTTIADAGSTLLIDGNGEEDVTGVSVDALACLLRSLRVPDAVISHMSATRALDGRQEDRWSGFTASWSYHPDQGMDLIVRTV